MERVREENEVQRRREAVVVSQTPSMDVPDQSMGNQVTIEVPNNILEVIGVVGGWVWKGGHGLDQNE